MQANAWQVSCLELRSFMNFCNYHSGCVLMYAKLSGQLQKMLRVGKIDGRKGDKKKLAWTTEAEEAFETLRRTLLGKLGLFFIHPDKGFVLRANASPYDLGAVLERVREHGSHFPVALWSRDFAEGQHRTSTAREKGTCAFFAICASCPGALVCNPLSCERTTRACRIGTSSTSISPQVEQPEKPGGRGR